MAKEGREIVTHHFKTKLPIQSKTEKLPNHNCLKHRKEWKKRLLRREYPVLSKKPEILDFTSNHQSLILTFPSLLGLRTALLSGNHGLL